MNKNLDSQPGDAGETPPDLPGVTAELQVQGIKKVLIPLGIGTFCLSRDGTLRGPCGNPRRPVPRGAQNMKNGRPPPPPKKTPLPPQKRDRFPLTFLTCHGKINRLS